MFMIVIILYYNFCFCLFFIKRISKANNSTLSFLVTKIHLKVETFLNFYIQEDHVHYKFGKCYNNQLKKRSPHIFYAFCLPKTCFCHLCKHKKKRQCPHCTFTSMPYLGIKWVKYWTKNVHIFLFGNCT